MTLLFQLTGFGMAAFFVDGILRKHGKEDIANFISVIAFLACGLVAFSMLDGLFVKILDIFNFRF